MQRPQSARTPTRGRGSSPRTPGSREFQSRTPVRTSFSPLPASQTARPKSARLSLSGGPRVTLPQNALVGLNFSSPTVALLEQWPVAPAQQPPHLQFAPSYTAPVRGLLTQEALFTAADSAAHGKEKALLAKVLSMPFEKGITDAGAGAVAAARAKAAERGFAPRNTSPTSAKQRREMEKQLLDDAFVTSKRLVDAEILALCPIDTQKEVAAANAMGAQIEEMMSAAGACISRNLPNSPPSPVFSRLLPPSPAFSRLLPPSAAVCRRLSEEMMRAAGACTLCLQPSTWPTMAPLTRRARSRP